MTNEEILAAIAKNALENKRLELRIEMLEAALLAAHDSAMTSKGYPTDISEKIDKLIVATKEWKSPL